VAHSESICRDFVLGETANGGELSGELVGEYQQELVYDWEGAMGLIAFAELPKWMTTSTQ